MVILRNTTHEAVSPAAAQATDLLRLALWNHDGWLFWHYRDSDGRLRPLDELRRRCQQKKSVQSDACATVGVTGSASSPATRARGQYTS